MKTIAVIGTNKAFNGYLFKILDLMKVDLNTFNRYMVKKENNYNYIVVNSNTNIKNIFINGKYCLINMDLADYKNSNIDVFGNIITYGLGNKNTVTVSSIDDKDSFVYCLQRTLFCDDRILEPLEIPVKMKFTNEDELYAAMTGITISLIEGKDANNLYIR
ncbi:hypothetical protein D4Z93_04180 [Clostridium fermenticellae]|uniref:Uncharacterized protein n=1 Tax=Clostridium fermenticellae TaxID=2068654 RepID=A0A386H255_9CLOT|nr:hypothetical protein [Clostridium fermenticellae]AYD39760.1 hypothetical protein D4Z93_04180 [Clostridium fermenticellae]